MNKSAHNTSPMLATSKSVEGSTPLGGVRSTIYYFDKDNKPTTKALAVAALIVEYAKDGKELGRTYMTKTEG